MKDFIDFAKDIAENPQKYAKELRQILGKIEYLNEPELSRFVEEEEFVGLSEININKVVGTDHPGYINLNWSEMLIYGKRMAMNLKKLKENPSYYLEKNEKKPAMEFLEIDGKLYVYRGGNHRTAIAKVFLNLLEIPVFGKVYMRRWKINHRAIQLERIAKQRGLFVSIKKIKVSRQDDIGWHKENYKILFSTPKGDLTVDDFEEFLTQKSFLKKVIGIFKFLGRRR